MVDRTVSLIVDPRALRILLSESPFRAREALGARIVSLLLGEKDAHDDPTLGSFGVAWGYGPPPPSSERVRPLAEWNEGHGDVLWWRFPVEEAPWIGRPDDLGQTVELHAGQGAHKETLLFRGCVGGWPGYHTHWTPLPAIPPAPDGG
jgi:hypothetical protein